MVELATVCRNKPPSAAGTGRQRAVACIIIKWLLQAFQIFFFNVAEFLFQNYLTRFFRIVGAEDQNAFACQQE